MQHSRDQSSHPQSAASPPMVYPEPEVRRWPHPICGTVPPSEPDSCLHYVHCTLVYQNQLLAEIKTLLEQLCIDNVSTADSSPQTSAEK